MHSLEAIDIDPDLRHLPEGELIVVGSVTIGIYKKMAGIPKEEHYVAIDDLDGCIMPRSYRALRANSKDPRDIEPDDACWVRSTYTGIETLRRSHQVPNLGRPVQLDIGTGVGPWNHKEVAGDVLTFRGKNILNPLRQLAWYEAMRRKKDTEKIEKLRIIIPKLWETVAIAVPAELRGLASDVLKPR